jgi:F-type H+-transporting ATPase subunit a
MKTNKIMKQIRSLIVLLVVMLMPLAANASHQKEGQIDIPEMVLEHLSDSYEWHIASYEGKNLSIPLPIIVRSSATGDWTLCTAENLPANYFFDAAHHGKIYEKMPDGTSVRPLDLSITKTVAQIWIVVFVLIAVFLYCAHWYKNRDEKSEAPRGFVGLMEMFVMTIYDDVIKAAIGEKRFKPFAPYLLTVFFFIFTTNLLGLLPIFPGGANVTGNINIHHNHEKKTR